MLNVPVHYRPGGTWGICQVCGFKHRLDEMSRDWRGLMVCKADHDPVPDMLRPPRVVPEGMARQDASPEAPDQFVGTVTPGDL
jgi:hypothetical protein